MSKALKKPAREDWHPADIKAALEKIGYTMAGLAAEHGYCTSFCTNAFRQASHKPQALIAQTLGLEPWDIWPTRYDENNEPILRRKVVRAPVKKQSEGHKNRQPKDTAALESCNGHVAAE